MGAIGNDFLDQLWYAMWYGGINELSGLRSAQSQCEAWHLSAMGLRHRAILQPRSFSGCSDIQQVSGVNTYCWDHLDSWLNAIASTSYVKAVIFTFGGTPCQLVNVSDCGNGPPADPNGLAAPPTDLTTSGSPSFNAFVTNLVGHCSPPPNSTNCVATIIKNYEMWNEPNGQFWYASGAGGTEAQLEEMVFPARGIIWTNVTSAVVMTPGFAPPTPTMRPGFKPGLTMKSRMGRFQTP
jgi:hypothetical protein